MDMTDLDLPALRGRDNARLVEQRDLMRVSADKWRGRAIVAETKIARVTGALETGARAAEVYAADLSGLIADGCADGRSRSPELNRFRPWPRRSQPNADADIQSPPSGRASGRVTRSRRIPVRYSGHPMAARYEGPPPKETR